MRLHWSVKDKKVSLDNAVKLDYLYFAPVYDGGKTTGIAWLKINQSGCEFMEKIHDGCLELRWPSASDNPFDDLPMCRFSIEEIVEVSFHDANDPDRKGDHRPTITVEAKVKVLWHLFLEIGKTDIC